jgi:hypothetical protein
MDPVPVSAARRACAGPRSKVAAAALLTASLALASCGSGAPACDLDTLLRARAGAHAINCGRVALGASSTTTDQCVADQGAAGAPFYAHYDVQGIDSRGAFGVLRDESGQTSVLLWDSAPSGGSGAPARITEYVCGGDPPVQTQLTEPGSPVVVGCTVTTSSNLACG